ncbi:hypothetical protein DIPPA_19908 [Diplonema papillatum]|nr:hypothetical protein DIPPA_19908 [Diplonema papillatum]
MQMQWNPAYSGCGCAHATNGNHSCTQHCKCNGGCKYNHMPMYPPGYPMYPDPNMYSGYGYPMYPAYPQGPVSGVPLRQPMNPGYPPPMQPQLPQQQGPQHASKCGTTKQTAASSGAKNGRKGWGGHSSSSYGTSGRGSSRAASSDSEEEIKCATPTNKDKPAEAKLLGLLNKISEKRYAENFEAINALLTSGEIDVETLVTQVHEQALVTPYYALLYARLCEDLCRKCAPAECTSKQEMFVSSPFRTALLAKCQARFAKVIEGSELDKYQQKSTLQFIAALYCKGVVGSKTIFGCLSGLRDAIKPDDNEPVQIELLLDMLKTVERPLKKQAAYVGQLDALYNDLRAKTASCSNRVKFLVMKLGEQR